MVPHYAPRFVACGTAMAIEAGKDGFQGGCRVSKHMSAPEFAVALSSPLAATRDVQSLDVVFDGDCNYFAIGVAIAGIPLDASPRRLEIGSAWFLLNKGFLCDGRVFTDDTLDPIGKGKCIRAMLDMQKGEIRFSKDAVHLGTIKDVSGDDLRFFCYFDGEATSCTIISDDASSESVSIISPPGSMRTMSDRVPEAYDSMAPAEVGAVKHEPICNMPEEQMLSNELERTPPNGPLRGGEGLGQQNLLQEQVASCELDASSGSSGGERCQVLLADESAAVTESRVTHGLGGRGGRGDWGPEWREILRSRVGGDQRSNSDIWSEQHCSSAQPQVGVSAHLVLCAACRELSTVQVMVEKMLSSLQMGSPPGMSASIANQSMNSDDRPVPVARNPTHSSPHEVFRAGAVETRLRQLWEHVRALAEIAADVHSEDSSSIGGEENRSLGGIGRSNEVERKVAGCSEPAGDGVQQMDGTGMGEDEEDEERRGEDGDNERYESIMLGRIQREREDLLQEREAVMQEREEARRQMQAAEEVRTEVERMREELDASAREERARLEDQRAELAAVRAQLAIMEANMPNLEQECRDKDQQLQCAYMSSPAGTSFHSATSSPISDTSIVTPKNLHPPATNTSARNQTTKKPNPKTPTTKTSTARSPAPRLSNVTGMSINGKAAAAAAGSSSNGTKAGTRRSIGTASLISLRASALSVSSSSPSSSDTHIGPRAGALEGKLAPPTPAGMPFTAVKISPMRRSPKVSPVSLNVVASPPLASTLSAPTSTKNVGTAHGAADTPQEQSGKVLSRGLRVEHEAGMSSGDDAIWHGHKMHELAQAFGLHLEDELISGVPPPPSRNGRNSCSNSGNQKHIHSSSSSGTQQPQNSVANISSSTPPSFQASLASSAGSMHSARGSLGQMYSAASSCSQSLEPHSEGSAELHRFSASSSPDASAGIEMGKAMGIGIGGSAVQQRHMLDSSSSLSPAPSVRTKLISVFDASSMQKHDQLERTSAADSPAVAENTIHASPGAASSVSSNPDSVQSQKSLHRISYASLC